MRDSPSLDHSPPSRSIKAWSATIGLLALVVIGVLLCIWQIGRAYEKRALQADLAASISTPADRQRIDGLVQPVDRQTVLLEGEWIAGSILYLDNRALAGRAGVHALQALRLRDGRVAWVNRGWLPKAPGEIDPRRQEFEKGLVGVATGSLAHQPAIAFLDDMKRLELGPDTASEGLSHLWQNFDLGQATNRLRALGESGKVLPAVFWLVPAEAKPSAGFSPDIPNAQLPPVADDAESQHWGYALQWSLLSLAAAVFAYRLSPRRRQASPTQSTP